MHIVPPNHVIADLEREPREYEKKAETEHEPEAARLREAAKERRGVGRPTKERRWHS